MTNAYAIITVSATLVLTVLVVAHFKRMRSKCIQQITQDAAYEEDIVYLQSRLRYIKVLKQNWSFQVIAFKWKVRGKKLTQRQKNYREFLRQQGYDYMEEEIELRKDLYHCNDDQHQYNVIKILVERRDDLAKKHKLTWLRDF